MDSTRATAELIGPTTVKFVHGCGHVSRKDYSKGPVSKRVGPLGMQILARYWKHGTVFAICNKCRRRP